MNKAGDASRERSSATLTSFNPAIGEVREEIPADSPAGVRDAVELARKVAYEWATIPPQDRAGMLREVRHRIHRRLDDIVETVAAECGKPRAEALAHDVVPAAMTLMYYERTAPKALRKRRIGRVASTLTGMSSVLEWRPYGVVGCISPWNYPFHLSFMAMAPALFAGNTVVLKPSEVTPAVGEIIREVLEPLPVGVATVVQGGGDVGAALVDAPCDKIAFIGSPATGRKIAAAAAKHLTPVVMELGGMDAAIVCSDADLDVASSGIVWGGFFNAGQTCCSIERCYVVDSVADEFIAAAIDKLQRVKCGGRDCEIGAITAGRQLEVVKRHVEDAVAKGARVLTGGEAIDGPGRWFQPTIIDGVTEDMDVLKEETFGPVLPILRVRDEDAAVRRANSDGFNLTASVWTKDKTKGRRVAARLEAGSVSINDHGAAAGVPWAPWGGVGESGYGRLGRTEGLFEFVAPVHVGRSLTPGLKRLWWYPYDESTEAALRGIATLVTSPSLSKRAGAARDITRHAWRAVKEKI